MGSGAEVAHETVDWLVAKGERVGVVEIRLYRPFPAEALLAALPPRRSGRWPCSTGPRSPAPPASRCTWTC